MFPRATNGRETNNNHFSPCSREDIRAVLESDKSDCFGQFHILFFYCFIH